MDSSENTRSSVRIITQDTLYESEALDELLPSLAREHYQTEVKVCAPRHKIYAAAFERTQEVLDRITERDGAMFPMRPSGPFEGI